MYVSIRLQNKKRFSFVLQHKLWPILFQCTGCPLSQWQYNLLRVVIVMSENECRHDLFQWFHFKCFHCKLESNKTEKWNSGTQSEISLYVFSSKTHVLRGKLLSRVNGKKNSWTNRCGSIQSERLFGVLLVLFHRYSRRLKKKHEPLYINTGRKFPLFSPWK